MSTTRSAAAKAKMAKKWTVLQWFANGECGMSSEALMRYIHNLRDPAMGRSVDTSHPYDPSDLRRCRLALELTGGEHLIEKARGISKVWNELVSVWPDLCKTMDSECPKWREGKGYAPQTYAMITAARDRAFAAKE